MTMACHCLVQRMTLMSTTSLLQRTTVAIPAAAALQCRRTIQTSFYVSKKRTPEAIKYTESSGTLLQRIRKKIFRESELRVSKTVLLRSGNGLATTATHKVDVVQWFKAFDMPDTFFSWWLVTEIHAWMLCTRVKVGDTADGEAIRNIIIEGLWEDLETRTKQVSGLTGSRRKNQVWDLAEEFQTALVVYDVGALGDDMALANAVWKRFFLANEDADPQKIELLVKYIRKTMAHLDSIPTHDLYTGDIQQSKVNWFNIEKVAKE